MIRMKLYFGCETFSSRKKKEEEKKKKEIEALDAFDNNCLELLRLDKGSELDMSNIFVVNKHFKICVNRSSFCCMCICYETVFRVQTVIRLILWKKFSPTFLSECLALLHSEWSKLHKVSAILSAIRLK